MSTMYDLKFLYDVLYFLSQELEQLQKWSIYNQDIYLDEIHELSEEFEALKNKLTALNKNFNDPEERITYETK